LPIVTAHRHCPSSLPIVTAHRHCPSSLPIVTAHRLCPSPLPTDEKGETVIDNYRFQAALDGIAKLHLGFTAKALADPKYKAALASAAKAIGKPYTPSALPLGGFTGAALGSSMLSNLSLGPHDLT
jgi:hypothetical protein